MKGIKTNNKGFSLVELIIVIAIMAILVAVLAPQYLKYVERSRYSRDVQMVDQLYTAVQAACAEPENSFDGLTVTFDGTTKGTAEYTGTGADNLKNALADSFGVADGTKLPAFELKSSKWGGTEAGQHAYPVITITKNVATVNDYLTEKAAASSNP